MNSFIAILLFFAFLATLVFIQDLMHYRRERWLVENGYSYDSKLRIWTKINTIEVKEKQDD